MRSGIHYQTRRRDRLTARQEQVLALIAAGCTNGEIAERLGMTLDGAKWHVSELISTFGVQTREEAAQIWQHERSLGSRLARGLRAVLLPILAHKTVAAGVAATAVIVAGSAVAVMGRLGATSTPAASPTVTAALAGQSPRMPKEWHAAGSNPQGYEMGVDPLVQFGTSPSAFISGPPGVTGFATLMQNFKSDDYRGKRLRLSAMVRSVGVTGWAGLWLRVDGQQSSQVLAFDNMENRPIVGTTDWTPYSVVLDVDQSSVGVAFGLLLGGTGQVWVSNLRVEIVGNDIAVTDLLSLEPLNLDFSQTSAGSGASPSATPTNTSVRMPDYWGAAGSNPASYQMGVDSSVQFDSRPSAFLSGPVGVGGFGTLMQQFKPDHYRGKRVQFSAMVRTTGVSGGVGLWLRIDGPAGAPLAFDNMQNRPIVGTTDWTRYSVTLDVGESSVGIAFGVLLSGPGQAWISDLRFGPVASDVASTDLLGTIGSLSSGPLATPPSASGPLNLDFAQ